MKNCKICSTKTLNIFNINLEPILICENCASSIFIQRVPYYIDKMIKMIPKTSEPDGVFAHLESVKGMDIKNPIRPIPEYPKGSVTPIHTDSPFEDPESSLFGMRDKIIRGKAVGNTTRIVDNAIQVLFSGKDITIQDHQLHSREGLADRDLLNRIEQRLRVEHKISRDDIIIVRRGRTHLIKIKNEVLNDPKS